MRERARRKSKKRLRILLDTNILISGLYSNGAIRKLLLSPEIKFITTDYNMEEFREVARRLNLFGSEEEEEKN
jgi:predicted nucleic acid-binding protein